MSLYILILNTRTEEDNINTIYKYYRSFTFSNAIFQLNVHETGINVILYILHVELPFGKINPSEKSSHIQMILKYDKYLQKMLIINLEMCP